MTAWYLSKALTYAAARRVHTSSCVTSRAHATPRPNHHSYHMTLKSIANHRLLRQRGLCDLKVEKGSEFE